MRVRPLLSLVPVILAVALAATGPAAAAQPGTLSAAEYQQLHTAQKRIRSIAPSDTRNLATARSICTRMRPVSRLIADVRRGCLALVRLGGDNAKLNAQATKCGINPGSEQALLTCLIPTVRGFHADAEAFYQAESAVNRLARHRGFGSRCVAVIGDSPGNVAAEGRLAGDLQAAVNALAHQDPGALQTLSANIKRDADAIRPAPRSLTFCPRR
ncbi:MAG: hypothetical protein KGL16_08180 [Acidobacteriota bacterium]|nr:hypothetical protein [Acidobacteriota bacterium]